MENRGEASIARRNRVFLLIGVIAGGFTLCAVMKAFVCGKTGERCPC